MTKLLPHQKRVIDESVDLKEKMDKLYTFTHSPTFEALAEDEQLRLVRQLQHMAAYHGVLNERIDAFGI